MKDPKAIHDAFADNLNTIPSDSFSWEDGRQDFEYTMHVAEILFNMKAWYIIRRGYYIAVVYWRREVNIHNNHEGRILCYQEDHQGRVECVSNRGFEMTAEFVRADAHHNYLKKMANDAVGEYFDKK